MPCMRPYLSMERHAMPHVFSTTARMISTNARYLAACLVLTLHPATVKAGAIGMPTAENQQPPVHSSRQLGYAFGYNRLDIQEPGGSTVPVTAAHGVNLLFASRLPQQHRLWLNAHLQALDIDADSDRTGQHVRQTGLGIYLQRRVLLPGAAALWTGIGGDLSSIEYTHRHLVDDEGYLIQTLPPRKQRRARFAINGVAQFKFENDLEGGVKLEHIFDSGSGLQETSLAAVLLMRY